MRKYLILLALLWGLPAWGQGMPTDSQGAACIASATAPTFTQGNWGVLSCDLAGGLRISGGGGGGGGGGGTVTQGPAAADTATNRWPVLAYQGGTWAMSATQAGTWNINNITGTVSLPTGAATAAKQPALGTAGTPSADVITVQGSANGTPQPVTNSPSTGATLATSQPSVGTTASQISAAGAYAHRQIYVPATATASVFIGASGVTTTTGFEIPPGASSGDLSRFSGAIFAVAASSQTVRLISY